MKEEGGINLIGLSSLVLHSAFRRRFKEWARGHNKLILDAQFPISRQRIRTISGFTKPDREFVPGNDIDNVLEDGVGLGFVRRFTRIQDDAMSSCQRSQRLIEFFERYIFSVKRDLA